MATNNTRTCPTAGRVCIFLSKYSAALLGCGATCIRLTKNVERIARVFNKRVEIMIMPRHVQLSVSEEEGTDGCVFITSIAASAISFNKNTRLSRLSWELADGKIDIDKAERRFEQIMQTDYQNPAVVLCLASLANASFCRLFGGDFFAMAVVFVATAVGYYFKLRLLKHKVDLRVTVFLCSFISSVLGASDCLFVIGSTPTIALGTSVLYLVPGIPFLNSFSDMLYRHYICAFSRFAEATVLTCCLSAGLCVGMLLMNVGMF